jgi:hypothetical protein
VEPADPALVRAAAGTDAELHAVDAATAADAGTWQGAEQAGALLRYGLGS